MATHFSVLAWRVPGTGEPGGLPSTGSHRVGHDGSDLAAADCFLGCLYHFTLPIAVCKMNQIYPHNILANICYYLSFWFRSDQISRSVMSDSLRPHESQHARPPCPTPTPGVHWDSRPSSQWCHPAISSSVVPFSSCPQSLPASESFPMSQLFAWGGQNTGVSALASFLPKKSLGSSPSDLRINITPRDRTH